MEITGGCLCRAVRYRISAPPLVTRVCWCRLCQYLGAGNATVNTCFPKDAVQFAGTLRDYLSTATSQAPSWAWINPQLPRVEMQPPPVA